VTVRLLDDKGAVLQSTMTDAKGNYTFTGLDPSKSYRIQWVPPADWLVHFTLFGKGDNTAEDSDAQNTGRDAGKTNLFRAPSGSNISYVQGNTEDSSVDAGLIFDRPFATVNGRVWLDVNANGILDGIPKPNEPAVPGVKVQLLDDRGTVLQTTRTDASGTYLFDVGRDPARQYRVHIEPPAGDTPTFFHAGQDPTRDSDMLTEDSSSLLFRLGAGQSLALDAGLLPVQPKAIVGPGVVPGNSQYSFTITSPVPTEQFNWFIGGPDGSAAKAVSFVGGEFNQTTHVELRQITLQFQNVPAVVILEARQGGRVIATKEIVVVQVNVTTAPEAFVAGTPTEVPDYGNVIALAPASKFIHSAATPDGIGFGWRATVTLVGPQGNRGVDQIQVGFIQHITFQQLRGQYMGQASPLVSSAEGITALDVSPDQDERPLYDPSAKAVFTDATPASSVKTISSADAPTLGVAVTYEKATTQAVKDAITNKTFDQTFHALQQITAADRFSLDIVASTKEEEPNPSYWGEYGVNWTFIGSGTVGPPDHFVWTPAAAAGVTGPSSWVMLGLTAENISGTLGNDILNTATFNPPK